jgi:hypothetical protein
MDLPVCIGCGRTFAAQKSLSAHAARCTKNKSLKLADSVQRNSKKRRELEKTHGKKSKRARSERAEVIQVGIDVEEQLDYGGMDVDHDIVEQVSYDNDSIKTSLTTLNLLRSRISRDHRISHAHPHLPQLLRSVPDVQYACLGTSSTTSLDQPRTSHICLPLTGSNEGVFCTQQMNLIIFQHHLHPQHLLSQKTPALRSSLSRLNPTPWVFIACTQHVPL